jgi:arylamine N-acetyltransferase
MGRMTETAAYLDRIGYQGPIAPTEELLRGLVAAHGRTIPFENLDPVLGVPVDDLSPTALTDKLVRRHRGGYCYEHNGLLGHVLDGLGFDVRRLTGRVVWMSEPGAPLPAMTHNVLAVTVPGDPDPFLVDVGFGGQTLTSPIRLAIGPVQQTRHEPYRIVAADSAWGEDLRLECLLHEQWRPLYEFGTRPRPRVDLEVGSWYVSTHPRSVFVVGLSAALVTDDARYNLRGRNLAVHRADGTEKVRLASADAVLELLAERFGIDVDDLGSRADVEARIGAVLDT